MFALCQQFQLSPHVNTLTELFLRFFYFDSLLQEQAGGHFFHLFIYSLWWGGGHFIHHTTIVCILWTKSNTSAKSFPKTNVPLRCKSNHNTFLKLFFTLKNLQENLQLHYRACMMSLSRVYTIMMDSNVPCVAYIHVHLASKLPYSPV